MILGLKYMGLDQAAKKPPAVFAELGEGLPRTRPLSYVIVLYRHKVVAKWCRNEILFLVVFTVWYT